MDQVDKLTINQTQFEKLKYLMTYKVRADFKKENSYMDKQFLTVLLAFELLLKEFSYDPPFIIDEDLFNEKVKKQSKWTRK